MKAHESESLVQLRVTVESYKSVPSRGVRIVVLGFTVSIMKVSGSDQLPHMPLVS